MKLLTYWHGFRISIAFHVIVAGCIGMPAAISDTHAQEKSLDEQLFSELDDQLFSDLEPLKDANATDATDDSNPSSLLDRDLHRELGGEDLGQRSGSNPLRSIADSMQEAKRRIQANDMATQTQQLQGRIVSDLEDLIEQLRKQNQQQQSGGKGQQQKNSPKQKQQQPNSPKQQSQGKPPGNKPSSQPAKQSTTRLGSAQATDASVGTRDRIMQDAWGNLPSSVQEEMRSARPEKFLPKYSRLIEDYFRRLSADRKK